MADNESTMKWRVDISQLKSAMQDAKRSISAANAEFKNATAGMDKWSNSATGLEAKVKQLATVLPQQKTILTQLEKQYALTADAMGENSTEAQKLKIQIENQKAAITKTETAMNKYNADLAEMNSASGQLNATISEQEKELAQLKTDYKNVALSMGEDSKEAKDLAKQITTLSSELVENKTKMANASKAADSLDVSLEQVEKQAKQTGDGFTVLKGTVANLAAKGITALVGGVKKVGKAFAQSLSETAKMGDEIDKGSQKLGITAENYQKLSYALELSGSSIDTVSKGVKNITSALADTSKGVDTSAKKFDALGISLKNADGSLKSSEDVLLEVIQALADTEDEVTRNSAANDIFGKSYSELLPLLNEGADGIRSLMQEAEDYNMIMSDDSVKASAKYQDSLDKLKGTMDGVKARIVSVFLPALTKITNGFSDLINGTEGAGENIKKGFSEFWSNIKKMAKKSAPEVYNSVIPFVEKAAKVIGSFITFVTKNFKTISKVVMAAVVAFTALNAAMAISKTVSAVSTAMNALAAGTSLATKAQVAYNAALASNPYGAILTLIAALAVAIVAFAKSESEATKAHKAEMEAIQELQDGIDGSVQSYNDLKEAQQKTIDAGMTEQAYYKDLYEELKKITDENGKIKDGYEARADFIINQLNEAYDAEITKTDNVIDNYAEIMESIDGLMEKKKAQILLDSQQALYSEAITEQADGYRNLREINDKLLEQQEQKTELEKQLADLQEEAKTARQEEANDYAWKMAAQQELIDAKQAEIDATQNAYNAQEEQLKEYAYNIGVYEQNMALAHEGRYDEMTQITWDYVKEFEDAENAQKAVLEAQIEDTEKQLEILKGLQASSDSNIYDAQVEQTEKRLGQLKEEFKQYETEVATGIDAVTQTWHAGINSQTFELEGHNVEFRDIGNGYVQVFIDGWKTGEPQLLEEALQTAQNAVDVMNGKQPDFVQAGEDALQGFAEGSANEEIRSDILHSWAGLADDVLDTFKTTLKENSPSKATDEDAVNLIKGFDNGFDRKKNSTLRNVSAFGKSVISTLKDELGEELPLTGVKASLAETMNSLKGSVASQNNAVNENNTELSAGTFSTENNTQNVTFNQTINSPKAVDGMTLYRETNNLLFSAKVRLGNNV